MDNAILEKYRGLAMILSYLSFIFSLLGPRSLPLCHIFKLWGIDHANKFCPPTKITLITLTMSQAPI